jgi:hypothetical protein
MAKQLIIVPLFGKYVDLIFEGHYILGLIDMKSKQITILDSLRGNHKQTYGIAFFALLELTNLIFCSQNITFVPSEWKLIIKALPNIYL